MIKKQLVSYIYPRPKVLEKKNDGYIYIIIFVFGFSFTYIEQASTISDDEDLAIIIIKSTIMDGIKGHFSPNTSFIAW